MVKHDQRLIMKVIGIADLKAHLSRHLQAVRRGETITVPDRREPIARLVPIEGSVSGLVIRPAVGTIHDVERPWPIRESGDVVEARLEERAERL